MIKIIDLDKEENGFSPCVIGLGNFDGVHIAHRTIMQKVMEIANERKLDSAVLLFKQHTNEVFPKMPPYYISSLQDKIDVLDEMGIDKVYIIDFTMEFAQLDNEQFALGFLRDRLNGRVLVCGSDYTFGKKSMGTIKELKQYQEEGLVDIHIVDDFFYHGKLVSSTIIRNLISEGNFEEATKVLGCPYRVRAKVVHGFKRGSKLLGFPTANLDLSFSYIMPKDALYLTLIDIDGVQYPSLTSVGTNPTFTESKEVKVETYILDFNGDLYDKEVKLKFIKKTRDQIKFDSAQDLIDQMNYDKNCAIEFFKNYVY